MRTDSERTSATQAGGRGPVERPAWVSIEGTNGVGKTWLAAQVVRGFGAACLPLVELPDSAHGHLAGQVVSALRASGDRFLRTGHPRTEALLLAALMVHRYEHARIRPAVQVVLEDRGPHSVAAYQGAILAEDDDRAYEVAREILGTIHAWRPAPDRVVLLRDDPAACQRRFGQRTGQAATAAERRLIARVDHLYCRMAADDPDRITVLDRREADERTAVAMISAACRAAIGRQPPCAR